MSYPLLTVPKLDTTTPAFRQALVTRALAAGLNPNYVAAVMSFESGFNPAAKNAHSGATGLIQWMPNNFPVSNLASLSAEQQLPYAISWFASKKKLTSLGQNATPTDYYLAVFLPGFMGYPTGTMLGAKGSTSPLRFADGSSTGLSMGKMYEQNAGFDTEKKGHYTVGDVGRKIEALVSASRGRPPTAVPLPVLSPPRPGRLTMAAPTGEASPTGHSSSRRARLSLSARIGSSRTVLRAAEPSALPPLVRGSHGPAVVILQTLLRETLAEGEEGTVFVDGEFGDQTELYVALHQLEAKLEPDGMCGPKTWSSFALDDFWGEDRIGRQAPSDDTGLDLIDTADPPALHSAAPHPETIPFELDRTLGVAVADPCDDDDNDPLPSTRRSGKGQS